MKNYFEHAISIIQALGFSTFSLHNTDLKLTTHDDNPELNLQNYLNQETALGVSQLQQNIEFSEWYLNTLKAHNERIPEHWQPYSLVYHGDQKIKKTQIKNGLYYFCKNYSEKINLKWVNYSSPSQNSALLIELNRPHEHLRIDEYFSNLNHGQFSKCMSYAHLTIEEKSIKTHFYFNDKLEMIHVHAYQQTTPHQEKKYLALHEINQSPQRYKEALDILQTLQEKLQQEINHLDLELNQNFFNLHENKNLEDFEKILNKINQLKSPLFDTRGVLIQKFLNTSKKEETKNIDKNIKLIDNSQIKIEKSISPQSYKKINFSKAQLTHETHKNISDLLQKIRLLLDRTPNEEQISNLFHQIHLVDLFLLEHFSHFSTHERTIYSKKLTEFKRRSLLNLNLFQNDIQQNIYTKNHHSIDSLLIHETSELIQQHFFLENSNPTKQNLFHEYSKLIMTFFHRNPIYEFWIKFILKQISLSYEPESIYSGIVKLISLSKEPNFAIFLAKNNLISGEECCVVIANRYFSLIQHLLLHTLPQFSNFYPLAEYLLSVKIDFFKIKQTVIFEKIVLNHNNRMEFQLSNPQNFRRHTKLESKNSLFHISFPNNLQISTFFSIADFLSLDPQCILQPDQQFLYLNYICHNPLYLFIYFLKTITHPNMEQVIVFKQKSGIKIFTSEEEFKNTNFLESFPTTLEKGIQLIFFPKKNVPVHSINLAKTLLNKILQLEEFQNFSLNSPIFIILMNHLEELKQNSNEAILIIHICHSLLILFAFIEDWTAEVLKKYFLISNNFLEFHYRLNMSQKFLQKLVSDILNFIISVPDEKLQSHFMQLLKIRANQYNLLSDFDAQPSPKNLSK